LFFLLREGKTLWIFLIDAFFGAEKARKLDCCAKQDALLDFAQLT